MNTKSIKQDLSKYYTVYSWMVRPTHGNKSNVCDEMEDEYKVYGWMVLPRKCGSLGLQFNEAHVYALIYKYNHELNKPYSRGVEYLARSINYSKQDTMNILQSLLQKNLLKQEQIKLANEVTYAYTTLHGDITIPEVYTPIGTGDEQL